MSTYLTIWHYLALAVGVLVFILTVILAFQERRSSVRNAIIFSSVLVNTMVGFLILMALDKYTKKAEVFNLQNHRQLETEKIIFTGVVKNTGKYTIGTIVYEIKMVNRGHAGNRVSAGSFFKPSGFMDFLGGYTATNQPQSLTQSPVIAEDLKPGESRPFRVEFDYPPYFTGVTQYNRLFAH